MDTRTPLLVVLGALLAALSLSVLGLSANNAAYYNGHKDSTIDIHYTRYNTTASAQYSYWLKLDAYPSQYTLGRQYAELAAGVICGVIGLSIAIGAWFSRPSSTKTRSASLFLPVSLALSATSFILSLGVTIYAWSSALKFPIIFRNSIPLPPVVSNPSKLPPTTYMSPFPYTPELWNCWIAPYIVEPSVARKMENLCSEAKVAKAVMVPVVVISALLVGYLAVLAINGRKGGEVEMEMQGGKEVDEVSVETASITAETKQ